MTDLNERFKSLDSLAFPGIEAPKTGPDGPATRRWTPAGSSRHSKLITIAVAFAIFLAAGVFTWRAFAPIERGGKRAGVSPAPQLLYVLDAAHGGNFQHGDVVAVQVGPTTSRVVATYPLGNDPDMAVSPDGTRLYGVATAPRVSVTHSLFKNTLRVYDTATGNLIHEVVVPDRQGTTGFHLIDKITVSPDGSRVYVLVGESDVPPREGVPQGLATFDTSNGVMLPDVAPLPGCVEPTILPGAGLGVTVVCRRIDEVRFLQVSSAGGLASEQRVPLPRSGATVTDANGNTVDVSYISQAVLSPAGGMVYAVTRDGAVFVIDVGTQRVTREVQLPLPTGYVVAVPQVTLSPSGDELYLGLGAYLHGDLVHATVIFGVDTSTWQKITTQKTPAFSAFRVANDGSRIFTVNYKSPTLGEVGLRPVAGYTAFGTVASRPLTIFTAVAPADEAKGLNDPVETPPCPGANDSVPNLPTVQPTSGPPGSTIAIRIPISDVGPGGGPASFNGKAEVWWNIDWNTWYDAVGPKGATPVVAGSVPTVLLTLPSDGTCELDGTFVVPADAASGTYPIVVIGVTSEGGSALSGPNLSFHVTG